MKPLLALLLSIFISPSVLASITCEGTGKTGTEIKYTLSAIEGNTISINYFISSRGKMEPIINGVATLVAEGRAMFGNNNVVDRSYVLSSDDNSYAILFLIYADGTAAFSSRPMEGTANYVEAKCK